VTTRVDKNLSNRIKISSIMHRFIVSFHFCPSRVPLSVIEGFSLGSYPFFLPLSHTRHAFYTLHSAFYCGLGSFIIIPHSFFCRLIRTIIIHCIFKLSTIVQSGRYGFKRCILHERFMDLSGITLDIFPRHAVKDILIRLSFQRQWRGHT